MLRVNYASSCSQSEVKKIGKNCTKKISSQKDWMSTTMATLETKLLHWN